MKASSVKYLAGQGVKSIWKNRMMTFASFCIMMVSLLMVVMSVLLSINLTNIISGIEGKSEVVVQIKDNTDDKSIKQLEKDLKSVPNINKVDFYSKEEAWENMLKDMTE